VRDEHDAERDTKQQGSERRRTFLIHDQPPQVEKGLRSE
jgi:hypothetical protein